jgi:hypothetical protein
VRLRSVFRQFLCRFDTIYSGRCPTETACADGRTCLILVIVGVLCGALGSAPLILAARSVTPATTSRGVFLAFGCMGVSFLILMLALLLAYKLDPAGLFVFGSSMLVGFMVFMSMYGLWFFLHHFR